MVIYFSGTGNSEYAAKRIAEGISDRCLNLFDLIRSGDHSPLTSKTPWVIVSPVYAWQLPHFLRDWLKETPLEGNRKAYFVLTCGDTVGNAPGFAKALCNSKGMEFMGLSRLIMPENYIAMFNAPDDSEAAEIVNRAEPVLCGIIDIINGGGTLSSPAEKFSSFKSGLFNRAFYALSVRDKKFFTLDTCTGCGFCEKKCPMNNIRLVDGKPQWQGNCTHCMACICHCPTESIEYGKISVGKVRYRFKEEFAKSE